MNLPKELKKLKLKEMQPILKLKDSGKKVPISKRQQENWKTIRLFTRGYHFLICDANR
jgi:hypothetical protein